MVNVTNSKKKTMRVVRLSSDYYFADNIPNKLNLFRKFSPRLISVYIARSYYSRFPRFHSACGEKRAPVNHFICVFK